MTVRDIAHASFRRWYVLVLVFALMALLAYALHRDGGTFTTRTAVTFTLPAATTLMANNGSNDSSVIAFAGAIASEINRGKPVANYSSADAPYYGAGVREGVLVSLRNEGNQWMAVFPSATIEIQIVGPTREWVEARQQQLLTQIATVAGAQQSLAVPTAENRITGTVEPTSTRIDKIVPSRVTEILAFAAMGLAGSILGIWAAVALDLAIRRRSAPGRLGRSRPMPTTWGGIAA
ncbi:hypothetical protein [Salinibacterium sp.]|uniref:hypothetical protein n=1 Tax=Salinibacterium sp. TaxID=1915057 RepID=UPI00286D4262|nr:hypothetical protein [Salinibacterium sp.]